MARYGMAALQSWDDADAVATTAWRVSKPLDQMVASTTTPTRAQEVAIVIRGGAARLPKWLEIARDSLNALSALPPNWNSYSASQIGVGAVTNAVELLSAVMEDGKPLPTFVPVANGGVLLEWHTMAADLEVAVLPSGRAHVVFEKAGHEAVEIEGLPQEVAASLKAFLQEV